MRQRVQPRRRNRVARTVGTSRPGPVTVGGSGFGTAIATTRASLRAARRARDRVFAALEALPKIATLLGDLRETGTQLEQLTTFAAQELPEIVYQLEAVRGQLSAIEQHLSTVAADSSAATPASPRTG